MPIMTQHNLGQVILGFPENTDMGLQEWFQKRDPKMINRLDTENP